MFKKTLIAAALMSVATLSQAAVVTAGTDVYGVEGYNAQVAADKVIAVNAIITTKVPYVENDIITVTITGADSIAAKDLTTPTLTDTNFVKFDGNKAIFRVNTNGIAKDIPLTLGNVEAKLSTAKDGAAISVASVATSINPIVGDYDAAEAAKYATFKTEHSAKVAPLLDGSIDVEKGRQEFTDGTSDVLTVTFGIEPTVNKTKVPVVATTDKIIYKLTGEDLSYLMDFDTTEDGLLNSTELKAAFTVSPASDTSTDADIEASIAGNTVTFVETVKAPLVNLDAATITANVKGEAAKGSILATQNFKLDVDFTTAAAPKALSVLAKADAGSWGINGAVEHVSFVPFSADYSIIATVSNTSANAAEIEIVVYAENGGVTSHKLATKAAANGLTNITAELNKLGIKGNVAMDIVVAAPETSIDASVIYYHKASQDRIKTL
ncbi:hypothetical protein [Shewanella morhuae]|uniref:EF-hand domain-containing protein n=1 Tax=Shewanella morhuae TaxID=365591 RepID=A0A380A849_9GAMM|nr:hypothetical protein [Shewanella morhuae]SUI75379.1 Uncharacterised protein [Shewanella morhuae]